ncbi:hypothetical protein BDK51DRAFT_51079 [Blyttiomyces helicus]|uniref:NmrA-like domain-containing protein n=1 Tax=Blyttiomyces helicus TaxID=388810 RepID=A0A4P9WAG7_9FUNG|nr:hypothetical protein BDK51DRAFT_51079 [Blyttiomyces helicus]|eukprot:RKO87850.1 hypothetical protein BDK51DRAFT_51079 [Blyttiomyces helicus]
MPLHGLKTRAHPPTTCMTTPAALDTLLLAGGSAGVAKEIADHALSNPFFKKFSPTFVARGAKVVELDYGTTDDVRLVEEFKGHKAVVLFSGTCPEGDNWSWKESDRMVDIAKAAGVQRVIPNVFGMDYNLNPEYSWLWPRRLVLEHIVKSGLEYTEFMVGWFGDFFFDSKLLMVDFDAWKATLFEPEMDISITYRDDVAKYLLASLQHRPAETANRSLRVSSARVSVAEMVRRSERALPSRGPFDITRIAAERTYDFTTPDDAKPKDGVMINPFLRMASRGTSGWEAEQSDNGLFEGLVEVRDVWAVLDEKIKQWKEGKAAAPSEE